jgi:hypothetical protein
MPEPTSESEADVLRRLVRGVVLAQGNLFIKELLRRKRIKIGSTKADFETNLLRRMRAEWRALIKQHRAGAT